MRGITGLYIHVPFCRAKCAYCDFYSMPVRDRSGAYVRAVVNELHYRLRENGLRVSTVYLGGGTPSSLSDVELSTVIAGIPLDDVEEFTIEVNPEDVSPERVAAWREAGINRVSMGVQTLDNKVLALIGRRHSARDAVNAYNILRDSGIDNISLDLIYGLPGQTAEGWRDTLTRTLSLRPEHLSAYSLSYETGTRLDAMRQAGKVEETPADVWAGMYETLINECAAAGYEHYEISNFSRPGFRAIHNSRYWNLTPYIGIGPGAHGWDGNKRYFNRADLKAYIDRGGIGVSVEEEETESERFNDMVFTALRTSDGLDLTAVANRFGRDRVDELLRLARHRHIPHGNIMIESNRLLIPEPRWIISNDIISDFMEV